MPGCARPAAGWWCCPTARQEEELAREVADADLLLMCYARISRSRDRRGAGSKPSSNTAWASTPSTSKRRREHGIAVVNVPAYAEETVAEGAFALLMAFVQALQADPPAPCRPRVGPGPKAAWLAGDLSGKTWVWWVWGASAAAWRAWPERSACGCWPSTRTLDPHLLPPGAEHCADLDTLLTQSDAVSIHCVLNAQTRHLLGAAQLARMKAGPFLVNVSRGEIVDEAAQCASGRPPRRCSAGRLRPGAAVTPQPHVVGTLRHGQRAAVAAPDLLHRRGDAAPGRRDAGGCFEALRGEPVRVASRDPRLVCTVPRRALRRRGLSARAWAVCWLLTICNMRPSMPYATCPTKS